MGFQIPTRKGNFEGASHCKVYKGPSAVSCAKTAEPIEMPFVMCTRVASGKHVLDGVHIGAIWRIRLNRPSAAAMRPRLFVKLL